MLKRRLHALKLVAFGAILMSGSLWYACGSTTESTECSGFDPECNGCRADGNCCLQSYNCAAGSICNDPAEDLYDAAQETGICIRVVCQNDNDCDSGKSCGLDGLCKPDVCQNDSQCPGSQICLGGTCADAPNVDQVAACSVVTPDAAIRQGATLSLVAVAKNANGLVLPGIPFDWSSSNTNVVSVSGNVATGGSQDGTATLTASPTGKSSLTCDGEARLTNFPDVPAGSVRVVLVGDGTGTPIDGANVTLVTSGGTMSSTTGANGAAMFSTSAAVESVTVGKTGYEYVSVLSPGGNDVLIPVPAKVDDSRAGGFRGKVDVSETRRADIKLGIAGPAIPSNLLDFGLDSLIGDSVPTVLDAPELSLNNVMVDLPGGVLFGFGNKNFTADDQRCMGSAPGENDIGCYLVRAPEGQTAGWIVAGRLSFSQVSPIAGDLASAFGSEGGDFDIGGILTAVLPLLRNLRHGVAASLDVDAYPKVNGQADFSKYQPLDLVAGQEMGVLSRVTIPNLPQLQNGTDCAAGTILIAGTVLEGRGIVPLGISAAVDALENQTADCRVAGQPKPFGENSADLMDGQMALAMAAPHSGLESGDLFMLLVALDLSALTEDTGIQFTGLVSRVDAVQESASVSGNYLPFPSGTVNAGAATVNFSGPVSGATTVRVELQRGDDTWLIYAPGDRTSLTLPNVAGPRSVLGGLDTAFLQAFRTTSGSYARSWEFGSGETVDRLVHNVEAFMVQECSTSADADCKIQ